jgi:hypothetical protein
VLVRADSIHRHFNPYDEQATCPVMRAKCAWMYLGLIQQGRSGPVTDEDRFGPGRTGPSSGRPAYSRARSYYATAEPVTAGMIWRTFLTCLFKGRRVVRGVTGRPELK